MDIMSKSIGESHDPHIAVIGAGISGLRAAGLLSASGFRVTILEARDRIGGRICQSTRFGQPIDLGASWIHGTEGNPMVALANETKSPTVPCGAVYSICDSNGSWLDQIFAGQIYEEVWKVLDEATDYSRAHHYSLLASEKMMNFFRTKVEEGGDAGRYSAEYQRLMKLIVEMWGAFMGCDCELQSLKNLCLDQGIEGGKSTAP
jgi:phytoene dehydrogenase-like protein